MVTHKCLIIMMACKIYRKLGTWSKSRKLWVLSLVSRKQSSKTNIDIGHNFLWFSMYVDLDSFEAEILFTPITYILKLNSQRRFIEMITKIIHNWKCSFIRFFCTLLIQIGRILNLDQINICSYDTSKSINRIPHT